MTLRKLTAHEVRLVAVESFADPRTVQKVVAGEPCRDIARARVVAAIQRLGLCLPGPRDMHTPPSAT